MPAHGKGSAKFGLPQINSDSTPLSASIDQTWDNPIIDLVIETDYVYKEQEDLVDTGQEPVFDKTSFGNKYDKFSAIKDFKV